MSGAPKMSARILVIDDDAMVRESFQTVLAPPPRQDDAVQLAARVLFDDPPSTRATPTGGAAIAFEVDLADSGAAGVAMARAALDAGRPYVVVFCDVRMPGIDGVETVERIRQFDRRAEVVFVTAYSDHSVEAILERAGANVGYFVKPFRADEMRQLATKLVVEWNKAREIEALIRALATLRGQRADVHRIVEHLLREVCLWLDTESAALLRRSPGGTFAFDLGVGALQDAVAARAVTDRLNGDLRACLETSSGEVTVLPDGTVVLPVHQFGVAIALSGRTRLTPDRRYLLELFLENASLALHNNEIITRLGEAERLATAGRALGFVLHDVRDPIGTAQMISRLLRGQQGMSAEAAEALTQIEFELQRAVDLIGDTMALCRGRIEVRPRALDAAAVLRDPKASWRVLLAQRGVRVAVSAPPGLTVHADASRLARALYNLTKNAADAVMGRDSPAVEVGARPVAGGVSLWVADGGVGVPEVLVPSLFRPFATAGKEDGTGFGLAIVKQIVEAHGGTVSYQHEGGRTVFTMYFPDSAP